MMHVWTGLPAIFNLSLVLMTAVLNTIYYRHYYLYIYDQSYHSTYDNL